MQISFGDGAFDAYVEAAIGIKDGYTVRLLNDGEELDNSQDLVPGVDVRFVRADFDGVYYMFIDEDGNVPPHEVLAHFRPWTEVARIHVY